MIVRLPSFDSEIDKARALAGEAREAAFWLVEALDHIPDGADAHVFDAASTRLAEMRASGQSFEAILISLTQGFGTRMDTAYARFDTVENTTRYERLIASFSGNKATLRNAVRARKRAIAETLKTILLEADGVHALLLSQKSMGVEARQASEPKLVASMDRRRSVVSVMDEARQRDKEVAALLVNVQRKIANPSDETRLAQWKADEAALKVQRDAVLAERERLARQHGVLDRQAVLLGDVIDLLNEWNATYTLLLNKLIAEAERCIQLYSAASGTLEPFIDDAVSGPLSAFHELVTLHAQGGVTMQDIERRKKRADEALARRGDAASEPGV